MNRALHACLISGRGFHSAHQSLAISRSSFKMTEFETNHFGTNAIHGRNYKISLDRLQEAILKANSTLYIVADFDHTLTTFSSKQCHDIIAKHDEYPRGFHKEFEDICSMSFETTKFHEWWRMAHDLIVNRSGLTEEMFQRGVKSSGIQLRSGTVELLALCRESKIPTIITSAGITNVITAVLEAHGVSSAHDEHFHIDSNHMEFHSDDGSLLRILPEIPVHSRAKKHVHKRAPHMFSSINYNPSALSSEFIKAESAETIQALQKDGHVIIEPLESEHLKNSSDIIEDVSESNAQNTVTASSSDSSAPTTAAIILGDNAGDFEVLSELSEINEAVLFRIGFAVDSTKAEKLFDLDCCDVILVGEEHSAEGVLKLVQNLVNMRTK